MFSPFEQFEIDLLALSLNKCIAFFSWLIGLDNPLIETKAIVIDTWLVAFLLLVFSFLYLFTILLNFVEPFNLGIKLFPFSTFQFIEDTLIQQSDINLIYHGPEVFAIFWLIFFSNIAGTLIWSMTITVQLFIPFIFSIGIIMSHYLYGVFKFGFKFFTKFVPSEGPLILKPLVTIIEFISYNLRACSLAVRLIANLLSGHILAWIITSYSMSYIYSLSLQDILLVYPLVPELLILMFLFLETAVSIIQAYIFTTLTCMYLADIIHLDH